MRQLFLLCGVLVVIMLFVYYGPGHRASLTQNDGDYAVANAAPRVTRTIIRRPITKTRTATRRPATRTPTPNPTFCERNSAKKWHFCGYHVPYAYAEGRARSTTFKANTPIRILVDGYFMEFRIANSRRSWTFSSKSTMQTVRLPKGTYSVCFNDATMYDCGGGWTASCWDGSMRCLFSPSGLGYGSSGEDIVVR